MEKNFLKNLANDLLTLEVSTIVKENTTNTTFPNTKRMALLDIARRYRSLMVEYGICKYADGNPPPEPPPGYKPIFIFQWEFSGEYSFKEIKRAADFAIQIYSDAQKEMYELDITNEKKEKRLREKITLLTRIQRQSSNMIGMYKTRRKMYEVDKKTGKEGIVGYDNYVAPSPEKQPPYEPFKSQIGSYIWNNDISISDINQVDDLELTPSEVTLIRKIWEIGVQKVLMQTVIQIDGDITCYITNKFLEYPEDAKRMLTEVHNNSINSATTFWKSLFMTVANLAGSTFSSKKRKR